MDSEKRDMVSTKILFSSHPLRDTGNLSPPECLKAIQLRGGLQSKQAQKKQQKTGDCLQLKELQRP